MISMFVDTHENFHPYECDSKNCRHCNMTKDETHDPDACALCDDTFDDAP